MLKDSSVHKVGIRKILPQRNSKLFYLPGQWMGKKQKLTLRKQTPTPVLLYYRQVWDLNLYYLCGTATPSQKNDHKTVSPLFSTSVNSKKKITKSCQRKNTQPSRTTALNKLRIKNYNSHKRISSPEHQYTHLTIENMQTQNKII